MYIYWCLVQLAALLFTFPFLNTELFLYYPQQNVDTSALLWLLNQREHQFQANLVFFANYLHQYIANQLSLSEALQKMRWECEERDLDRLVPLAGVGFQQ